MNNPNISNEVLQKILELLNKPVDTKFYNEPIFLAMLSIIFGGIVLNILTKNIEHRSKKREMAIIFINDIGEILNDVLSSITGYRKRKQFGERISESLEKKRGVLFYSQFSVKIKSKAYLGSDDFYKKYYYLIYKIDLLIYYLMKNDHKSIQEVDKLIEEIESYWPIEKKEKVIYSQKTEDLLHDKLILLERVLWDRANLLVTKSLDIIL